MHDVLHADSEAFDLALKVAMGNDCGNGDNETGDGCVERFGNAPGDVGGGWSIG